MKWNHSHKVANSNTIPLFLFFRLGPTLVKSSFSSVQINNHASYCGQQVIYWPLVGGQFVPRPKNSHHILHHTLNNGLDYMFLIFSQILSDFHSREKLTHTKMSNISKFWFLIDNIDQHITTQILSNSKIEILKKYSAFVVCRLDTWHFFHTSSTQCPIFLGIL